MIFLFEIYLEYVDRIVVDHCRIQGLLEKRRNETIFLFDLTQNDALLWEQRLRLN